MYNMQPNRAMRRKMKAMEKTMTGDGAPRYAKHKIEGDEGGVIDKVLAYDIAARAKMADLEKAINALEVEGQKIFEENTLDVNTVVAGHIGKSHDEIVILQFDTDLKLLVFREKTDAELQKAKDAEAAKERAATAANDDTDPKISPTGEPVTEEAS